MRTNQTQKIDFYFTNLKNLIMSKVYDINKFTGIINSIEISLSEFNNKSISSASVSVKDNNSYKSLF